MYHSSNSHKTHWSSQEIWQFSYWNNWISKIISGIRLSVLHSVVLGQQILYSHIRVVFHIFQKCPKTNWSIFEIFQKFNFFKFIFVILKCYLGCPTFTDWLRIHRSTISLYFGTCTTPQFPIKPIDPVKKFGNFHIGITEFLKLFQESD